MYICTFICLFTATCFGRLLRPPLVRFIVTQKEVYSDRRVSCTNSKYTIYKFFMARYGLVGQGLFTVEALVSRLDTSQSVELLCMSDQPYSETSIWQHTTLIRDWHPCLGEIRTRNPCQRAAANLCLRPRGHRGRDLYVSYYPNNGIMQTQY
jgi:hypothetical protein